MIGEGGRGKPEPGESRHPEAAGVRRRFRRLLLLAAAVISLALLAFSCSGCSPVYVARAGWTEVKILAGRTPLQEVIQDPETDAETRNKLLLTRQARAFAIHMLSLIHISEPTRPY